MKAREQGLLITLILAAGVAAWALEIPRWRLVTMPDGSSRLITWPERPARDAVYQAEVGRAIVRKDLLLELRTWERLAAMAGLAVLVAVLLHFAVDTGHVRLQSVAAGLVWITIIFGGMVGMGRTFKMEEERKQFENGTISHDQDLKVSTIIGRAIG